MYNLPDLSGVCRRAHDHRRLFDGISNIFQAMPAPVLDNADQPCRLGCCCCSCWLCTFIFLDFSYTSCCWTAEQLLLLFVVATSAAVPAAAGSGGGGGGYDCYHSHYLHVSSVLVIVYVLLLILWGLQNKCINENPRKTSEGKQTAQWAELAAGRHCRLIR